MPVLPRARSVRSAVILFLLSALTALSLSACGGNGNNSLGAAASLVISPGSASVTAGKTQQFSATVKDAAGNLLPGAAVTWSSSASNVATVNASGLATGVAAGSATITAASGAASSTAALTVTAPPVATITVAPAAPSVTVGATQQFTATAKDANGNVIATGLTFTWTSATPAVATVNASGLATAVSAGTSQITATAGGITSPAVTLTVNPPPVASVTVAPAAPSVNVGATQQFTATAKDAGGNVIPGATFTWTSSATAVATISASGLATGVAAGTSNVTATSGGITSAADVLTVTVPATVTGTAAHGSALAGLTVTLKDATGASRTATTASDGTYSINASGLTPPYLVMVQPSSGPAVYSVSADPNTTTTINLDPLTDLVIRSWYSAQGVSVDTAFASPTAAPAPTPSQAGVLVKLVQNVVQLWLTNNGVTDPNFNLISSTFAANGTGVDKVLDETTVNPTAGTVAVTDGTTTQNSTLTYTTASNSVTVTTTTTSGGASSTSTSTTVVPAGSGQAAALAGIQATAATMTQVMAAKGAALADTDLEPFMTANLMFQGLNQAQFAAELVTFARGQTSSFTVTSLTGYNATNGTANANVLFQLGQAQLGANMVFVSSGGSWLLAGDQREFEVDVSATVETQQNGAAVQSQSALESDIKSPVGLVTAATISGGGIFSNTTIAPTSQLVTTYAPTSTTTLKVTLDHFNVGAQLTSLVPAGTPFTFNATTTGGPVQYVVNSNANTTEAVQFTGVTSSSLSAVTLGANNTFNWTLPKTFPIANMELKSDAFNGNPQSPSTTDCRLTTQITSLTATSGTIGIPASCSGTITNLQIILTITGVNGEVTEVSLNFQ